MGTIPVTITGTFTAADGSTQDGTFTGDLGITGLEVGGGPMPGGPPPTPIFPIWGPPGIELPPIPGYPPVAGHPLPPTPQPPQPPAFVPIWHPDYGWVVVPVFPHPSPSKK